LFGRLLPLCAAVMSAHLAFHLFQQFAPELFTRYTPPATKSFPTVPRCATLNFLAKRLELLLSISNVNHACFHRLSSNKSLRQRANRESMILRD
jgi:hypothetical protein